MNTYYIRHAESLDIDDATRRWLWNGRQVAIRFPRDRNGDLGPWDNESLDPNDYDANARVNIAALLELARQGGYVVAEYHGHDEYLVGRVEPGSEVELMRGRWGDDGPHPGRKAVLKTLRLHDVRVRSADDLADILQHRPRRGTLRRWRLVGNAVARMFGDPGKPDTWEYARRCWVELVRLAEQREVIEYGELADSVGQSFTLAVRFPLAQIYWYCDRERLPPLTVLVISKQTGFPTSGFGELSEAEFEELREEVYAFDWDSIPNPFAFAEVSVGGRDPVSRLLQAPAQAAEVYALVKSRGARQIVFREAVSRAYGGRCAFSGSAVNEGLEAAHIVPWSNASAHQRLDVRNGLLLTAWHHRLFDAGLLWVDEEYRIHVDPRALKSRSDLDRAALAELDGKPLRLPRKPSHRPDPQLIHRRNEIMGTD